MSCVVLYRHTTLVLDWNCLGIVLALCRLVADTASVPYWHCLGTVLVLYGPSASIMQALSTPVPAQSPNATPGNTGLALQAFFGTCTFGTLRSVSTTPSTTLRRCPSRRLSYDPRPSVSVGHRWQRERRAADAGVRVGGWVGSRRTSWHGLVTSSCRRNWMSCVVVAILRRSRHFSGSLSGVEGQLSLPAFFTGSHCPTAER